MKTFLFFLFVLASSFSHSADTFERNVLSHIAQHFNKKLIPGRIDNQYIKDLTLALELFYDLNNQPSESKTKKIFTIDSTDALTAALEKKHWPTIKNCLVKIATAALKKLLNSTTNEEEMRIIKTMSTNRYIPKEMRNALLNCFNELKHSEIKLWLSNSGHEDLLNTTVDLYLEKGQLKEAVTYIESRFELDSFAYKQAYEKILNYLFERNKLFSTEEVTKRYFKTDKYTLEKFAINSIIYYASKKDVNSAELMLEKYLTKNSPTYTEGAIKIFNSYSLSDQWNEALQCVLKHFTHNQAINDKLVLILAANLITQKDKTPTDVKIFLIRNMSRQDVNAITEILDTLQKK